MFLAALMVLSVFAMSVSFAGAAAADVTGVTVSTDTVNLLDEDPESVTVDVSHADTDDEVAIAIADEDDEIVYSEELATAAGATSTEFADIDVSDEDEGEYTVYAEAGADVTAPDEGDDVGDFGDDPTAAFSVIAQVTVDNLDNQEVYQGQQLEVSGFAANEWVQIREGIQQGSESVGQVQADANGVVTVDTSGLNDEPHLLRDSAGNDYGPFEVVEQDITAEFTADTVAQTNTELTYESENRDEAVDLQISSEQLDGEELEAIFGVDNADDGVVTVEDVSPGDAINADFSDVETGEYDFTVSVADTTAEADASIEVTEAGEPTAQFDQSSYSEEAGDIVEFTVEMEHADTAEVDLSEKDGNYDATLEVTDEDGDGEVTVYFNTYLAGDDSGNWDPSDAFYTAEDSDDTVEVIESNDNTGDSRLLPGDFNLELFTVEDGDRQKVDAAFLRLTEGSIDSISSGAAPSDADLETVEDIMENSKKSDEIANGDRVLFAFEASGVFGAIDVDEFEDHFDLVLEQTNDQYDDGAELDEDQYEIVEDPENDRFFVVLNMDEVDMEAGDEFELRLEPNTDEDGNIDSLYFINDEDYKKGSGVIVSTQFNIVERTLEITGDFDKEDRLMVPNHEEATITGHSNAAPGTSIQVNVDGDSMYQGQTVQVQKGGTIEATFDLSEYEVGDEFTVRMTDGNGPEEVQDEVDAILVKGDKHSDDDEHKDGDDKKDDEKDNDEKKDNNDDKKDDDNNDDEQPGSPADDQPGFGIAVALIALLAAAGIALRRQ